MALKRLSRMWTTPILLCLLERPHRHAELLRALAPISAKVLTQRLNELAREGLILRSEVVSAPPKTVVYAATAEAEGLRPLFSALRDWNDRAQGGACAT